VIRLLLSALAAAAGAQAADGAALARGAAAANAPEVVVDQRSTGAWYRKLISPESPGFDGIKTAGVLPAPSFDPGRMHTPAPSEKDKPWTEGPLDSPSVYVGAHGATTEVDAGLKWDHVHDASGADTGQYAWRVFWRVSDAGKNTWHNPAPGASDDVYLLPGDKFWMNLAVGADGKAVFAVTGGGQHFATSFALTGLTRSGAAAPRSFKRVHSIDQFLERDGVRRGNEGAAAIPTRARVRGGRWITAAIASEGKEIPLTGRLASDVRGGDEAALYPAVFPTAGVDPRGGEKIDIAPPPAAP